ncbi:Regulator of G-protein signaling 3 [Collichthys lucidus]|uniref:Regulator of G-protein signaling 3 n=1 Tax=Collichthys lucidus TaxID=240159 RepID=A0A4U5VC14_COLLU|nr:Regulator of G-protein signaling 3 [Collichthys lucidus]
MNSSDMTNSVHSFGMELLKEKTLRMSVLLGCMSFGVCSLMDPDKEVQGWYYLLGEELGRKKHLKVPTQHNYHPLELGQEYQPGLKAQPAGNHYKAHMRGP